MPDLFQLQTQTKTQTQIATGLASTDFDEQDFLSLDLKAKQVLPQIDWVITHRKNEFLDSLLNLQRHSSIQVRRKLATGIGLLGNKELLPELKKWQVHESDRQTWLILEASIDKLNRKLDSAGVVDVKVLSVSEAISQIKNLVSQRTYTIEGELSEVRPVRQMYYFSLKDKQDTKLDCWAFVGKIIKAGFPMNEGLMVRVKGDFKLSKFSKIYFDLKEIELTGQGELLRNFLVLKEKLETEGLFEPSRKRSLKKLPKKILLLASPTSAAISDFTKVLGNRIGGIKIYLLPIKTQGVGAELDILEKLEMANKACQEKQIDTVVITRGGGSKDDLWVFNSEKVVRKIHSLKAPSLVAIGHERDTTLAELVADVRASTPSQAAELVSSSREQILSQLDSYQHFFNSLFFQRKAQYEKASSQLYQIILHKTKFRIQNAKEDCRKIDTIVFRLLNDLKTKTQVTFQAILEKNQKQILEARYRLPNLNLNLVSLQNQVEAKKVASQTSFNLIQNKLKQNLAEKKHQFELCYSKIQAFDIQKTLDKGFTIVWQEGRVVESKTDYDSAKPLKIQFRDGEVEG